MRKQQLLLLLVIITALATTLFLPGLVRSEEIFIDNLDPEASCDPESSWSTSSWCSQRYLSNYHYHMANGDADTFIWDIAARGGYAAGRYDVFAYWCADPSRAIDATYTVYHDLDGVPASTVVMQNQQVNGGEWVLLGRFDFDGNDDEKVELVQSATGYTMADAIKVAPVTENLLIDNDGEGASFTGNWGISSWAPGFYGTNYHYYLDGDVNAKFKWQPTVVNPGAYEIFARWTDGPSRTEFAIYTIYHDYGITTVTRNMQQCGGEWNSIGIYHFDGFGPEYVELGPALDGIGVADAMYFERYRHAPVPRTWQTTSYRTHDDGDLQVGVHWQTPRFVDRGDGTVFDTLTRLIWLKNANCAGLMDWYSAVDFAAGLQDGECGLTDGSEPGDWRLPNIRELHSLVHFGEYAPPLSNAAGDGQWSEGDPFVDVRMDNVYWTSTTHSGYDNLALYVEFGQYGIIHYMNKEQATAYVWPVRGPVFDIYWGLPE